MIAGRHAIDDRRKGVRSGRLLSPANPSINQRIASKAQHQGTATWLFEGDMYTEWKSKSTASLLWIHGKRAPFCSLSRPRY